MLHYAAVLFFTKSDNRVTTGIKHKKTEAQASVRTHLVRLMGLEPIRLVDTTPSK